MSLRHPVRHWSPSEQDFTVCVSVFCSDTTARSRNKETWNGDRNGNQNPQWSSQVSFQTAHLKRDLNFDHRGFRFSFRWQFRVSFSRERAVCTQDTLQRTATHCSTLQHTATHICSQIFSGAGCTHTRHTATHYNATQHTATHCNTLQHTATLICSQNFSGTGCRVPFRIGLDTDTTHTKVPPNRTLISVWVCFTQKLESLWIGLDTDIRVPHTHWSPSE